MKPEDERAYAEALTLALVLRDVAGCHAVAYDADVFAVYVERPQFSVQWAFGRPVTTLYPGPR